MVGDLTRVVRAVGGDEEPREGPRPAAEPGGGPPLPLELTVAQWADLHARWRRGGSPSEVALAVTVNGTPVATGRVSVDARTFTAPCAAS